MPKRAQRNKKSNNSVQKEVLSNIAIGGLLLLTIGFFISFIDNLFFDDGVTHDRPDLATLITKTKYEEKTGHKITVEIQNSQDLNAQQKTTITNFVNIHSIHMYI